MNVQGNIPPAQDPADALSRMVDVMRFTDLPSEHVDYVKKDLLDMLGCILAGSTEFAAQQTVIQVHSWSGGIGAGHVPVFGDRAPVPLAAFACGVMARARDLGDTHNQGGHIGEWVVPTLLAGLELSDRPVSGKALITAFVAGAEWGVREHMAVHLQHHTTISPGECAGSRYATAALAKLLGLRHEQIWAAQGMMYSMHPQSEQQKYNEGSDMVRLQHGFVCADAVKAVALAQRNLSGIRGIYLGEGGLLKNVKHGDLEPPDFLTKELGQRWFWREDITMKPYAGCKYNHTPIFGLLELMRLHHFEAADINALHFIVSPGCRCTIEPASVKWRPATPAEAMFSNPYSVAYAALQGNCFLDAYDPDAVRRHLADPAFCQLMDCMTYTVDPSLSPFDGYTITAALRDGRVFSRVENGLLGNADHPMTWAQVVEKFWRCTEYSAVDLGNAAYCSMIEWCQNLDLLNDVRPLIDLLHS